MQKLHGGRNKIMQQKEKSNSVKECNSEKEEGGVGLGWRGEEGKKSGPALSG